MSTLRDRIETILAEEGVHADKIGTIAGRILALGRAGGLDITHYVGPNGFHRLKVGEEQSKWTPPTEIIRVGDLVATTDAFFGQLPQVGKVYALKGDDIKTESVQSLTP